jgi:hypothetical protein
MSRVDVPRTTLLCLDTLNHELAARALSRSLEACRFERAVFLTDRPVMVPGVEVVAVPVISGRDDYSERVLRGLLPFVDTEFALLIQWDGYVLNGDAWTDSFLQYDYIGARWWHPSGGNVGNGGFSLRSRRLLKAVIAAGTSLSDAETENEDEAICRRLRGRLEVEYGLRFAPENVADLFSIERVGLNPRPFGFHGLFNMAERVTAGELDWFCRRVPASAWRSREFFEFIVALEARGRTLEARRMAAFVEQRLGPERCRTLLEETRSLAVRRLRVRALPQRGQVES